MNQKGFANIMLIVLIIVVVGGAASYFYWTKKATVPVEKTQTADTPPPQQTLPPSNNPAIQAPPPTSETTDWKTFRSELAGIEVKYPPKYFVVRTFGNPGSDTFTSVTNFGKESDRNLWGKEVGGLPAHIQLIYHVNRRNLPIADLAKEWANSAGTTSSCKNLAVAGESAMRCSLYVEGEGGLYSDMIFLKHSGATYSFAANSPTSNDIVHSDLLEILATLKFLQ